MAWIKPKTDWNANYVGGRYIGDHFDYRDWNRILGNVNEVVKQSFEYDDLDINTIPIIENEMEYTSWVSEPDGTTGIATALEKHASKILHGTTFRELESNKPFWNAEELNKIESVSLYCHNRYEELIKNKPHREHFTMHFGMRGGL